MLKIKSKPLAFILMMALVLGSVFATGTVAFGEGVDVNRGGGNDDGHGGGGTPSTKIIVHPGDRDDPVIGVTVVYNDTFTTPDAVEELDRSRDGKYVSPDYTYLISGMIDDIIVHRTGLPDVHLPDSVRAGTEGGGTINYWICPHHEQPSYSMSFTKTGDKEVAEIGESITYTLVVTNTGNRPLTGVTVVDPDIATLSGATLPANLPVGGTLTLTGTVTPESLPYNNTATADSCQTNPLDAIWTVYPVETPDDDVYSIILEKAADKTFAVTGDAIIYTLRVENTGNRPIDVTLTDPMITTWGGIQTFSLGITDADCTAEVTGTAIATSFPWVNLATATATLPSERELTATASATVTLTPPEQEDTFSITVTKTASPMTLSYPGGTFVYSFVVNNTGNQPVYLTSVQDDVLGTISLPSQTLILAGASSDVMTASAIHTDVGSYTNNVLATASTAPTGENSRIQISYVTAAATLTVTVTSSGGGGGGGGGGSSSGSGNSTQIIIPAEETPLAPVTLVDDAAVLIEEETPLATLPKTGETDPLLFLGFGTLLAAIGLRMRKESQKER